MPKNNTSRKSWLTPVIHILAWIVFFSVPFILRDNRPPNHDPHFMPMPRPHDIYDRDNILYVNICNNALLIIVFYINLYLVAPLFSTGRRYVQYAIIQLAGSIVFYYIIKGIGVLVMGNHGPAFMQVFVYFIVILAALCYSLVQEGQRNERAIKEKETETLRSELSFLRWQVSPHFLFNVLNNMVSLARTRSDKLEGMLHDMSSLMRYMLYESEQGQVTIDKEANYIKSYIALQRVRLTSDVQLTEDVNIAPACGSRMMEPMLLIPFIENAFKHGINGITQPSISIVVHFDTTMVTMTVRNTYANVPAQDKDNSSGIGLVNVKRRLNLLYPNRHSLQIQDTDHTYVVTLGINIA